MTVKIENNTLYVAFFIALYFECLLNSNCL